MKQTLVSLIDDFDGTEAQETVQFGYQGKLYEIDLSQDNAGELEKLLGEYINVARSVGGATAKSARTTKAGPAQTGNAKVIRDWAISQGMDVPARGRVSASVRAAYDART